MYTGSTRMHRVAVLALLVLFAAVSATSGQEQNEPQDIIGGHFPYPTALRPQVEFWKKIFATYSRYQVVIHDTKYIDKVYKVLDFRPFLDQEEGVDEATVLRIKERQTGQAMERIRAILLKLHHSEGDGAGLNPEEQSIWTLYRDVHDPDKFLQAADEDRLHSQSGLRERFAAGIQISRRYLKEMEEIFRSEGLPVELTRLPLMESCFNVRAYSKAAAAGIWQFIPATGRLYMRVDGVIDERRDPLVSTWAAARLLKTNHEMLGTWPLAITAYNHGPYGMSKAVETLGTSDIAEIIRRYRGMSFGFASKNFYPEFLAALTVEKNYQKYFGPLQMEPPLRYEQVRVTDSIPLKQVARSANSDEQQILLLNPALQRTYVPRGYRLRVPVGTSQQFLVRYAALQVQDKAPIQQRAYATPKSRRPKAVLVASKSRSPKVVYATHKVRPGQTLLKIARQYNTTITSLKRLNGVSNVKRLQVGQTLRVPTS